MAELITVTVDGVEVSVPEGMTILDAAHKAGVEIPTLCFLKKLNEIGACRVCVVETYARGSETPAFLSACNNVVTDGMVVKTNSPRALEARRTNVQLALASHDVQCTTCLRGGNCALQSLAESLNLVEESFPKSLVFQDWPEDFPLIRDSSRCIKCGRCIAVCEKTQGCNIWEFGRDSVRVAKGAAIDASRCALCGQCITHCPTAALSERDDTATMMRALADPETVTVVRVAPAVRSAWAEEWGISREEASPGRMAAALRRLGFDYVFDTDFSADLTIMEEGSEFLERLRNKDQYSWPMFTSCCPGWVRYIKANWPAFAKQLSTAKSPQQMFGAVAKTWFAERSGIDAQKIFSVSVMPCIAKKHECALENMNSAGAGQDVDLSLTTREFARMLKAAGIDVSALPEEEFDSPLGTGSGAGVIFGATGGVMEAALRSAYFLVEGKNPDPDAFKEVRGQRGWRESTFELGGITLKVAVASGLANAGALMEAIDSGEVEYDFVEIMACPGGCAGGGGQPIHEGRELASERGANLYKLDAESKLRFSHENPDVQALYSEFLEAPLSHKAHELLHSNHADWAMPHK